MSLAITNGHEIMAPAMVMICAFSFTYSLANHNSQKSHQIKVSVGVLAGSLIGILILFGAPGNYARMEAQNYPPMPNIINAIKMSSGFYSIYLSKLLDNWNWVIFIALFFSGLFANTILPKNWTSFLITTLMIIGASWGTFLISTFAISETLPTRTQFIPSLFLVFGFFALGAIIPFQNQKFGILISASLLVFLFSISFPKIISRDYQLIAPIVQFAHDWDIREYDIKINGVAPYIIPIPWESSEQGFSCVSLYYSR